MNYLVCYKHNNCNADYNFSGEVINNIAYADNMSILSPLLKAYKILLTYEQYGKDYDFIFIPKRISPCVLQEKL